MSVSYFKFICTLPKVFSSAKPVLGSSIREFTVHLSHVFTVQGESQGTNALNQVAPGYSFGKQRHLDLCKENNLVISTRDLFLSQPIWKNCQCSNCKHFITITLMMPFHYCQHSFLPTTKGLSCFHILLSGAVSEMLCNLVLMLHDWPLNREVFLLFSECFPADWCS